jgi:peptide/nickel transport system substrate-binding protein
MRHNEGVHMFQSRRKLRLAGVAAAAAVALLAAGCGASSNSGTAPKGGARVKGGVATVANISGASANYIFQFAPLTYYSVTNYQDFMYLMNRPLYMFGNEGSSIAVNYPLSPAAAPVYTNGGKTVTITMKGWKWSNGESVDAKDVIFWLNMDSAEKTNFAGYSPGGIPDNVVSYKATGPDTVVLNLNAAYSSIWYTYNELAQVDPMPMAWDVSSLGAKPGSGGCTTDTKAADGWAKCKKVLTFLSAQAKATSTYVTSPIWSIVDGPWKLSAYSTDGNYTFVPNTKYSGSPKVSLSALKFQVYTADTAVYTALKSGSLDVGAIPSADLPIKPVSQQLPSTNPVGAANYYLQPSYTFTINFYQINYNNPTYGPVFKQLYFRQALAYLDDQTGMGKSIYRGYGYATNSGVPSQPAGNQWISSDMSANSGAGLYAFNPTKAASLLSSHGWTKSGGVLTCTKPGSAANECGAGVAKGVQAKFNFDYTSGVQVFQQEAEIYKSDLAKAGIILNATSQTFNTIIGEATPCSPGPKCTWQMLMYGGWGFNGPGFEPTGEPLFSTGASSNSGSYSNKQMDSLINATHTSNSLTVFHNYANYTAAQLPFEWMPNSYAIFAVNNKLQGVAQNPLLTFFPEYWYFTK